MSILSSMLSPPVYFSFKRSTLDFVQMASLLSSFSQLSVQKKGPPYSNCSETNGKFSCLNDCFRNNFRLARYFYEGNETGTIHLSHPSTNRTIERSERSCFEKCWRENCEIVQFILASENPRTTRLEAKPKLSEPDFWVQFIGLVCSFANISLNQFTSMVIKFACSRVKRRKVRIGLLCLKWAILFLSLTYCGYLYTSMVLKHQAEEKNPPRKEIARNHIKQKIVRLAICVNIEEYLTSDNDFYLFDDFDFNDLNKTMSEIERTTDDALSDHLEGIYMNYKNRMFRVDYTLEPKVLFMPVKEIYRCFILTIFPDYHLMPSNPKLTIKFKEDKINDPILYLLTEDENLNENTFEITFRSAFMKRIVRRLKSSGGCVNHRERYGNCTSRLNCIESCINKEALEKFKKIVIDKAVVDKDQFSHKEWNTIFPVKTPNDDLNISTYASISSRCFEKFQNEVPCVEVTFNETVKIVLTDLKKIETDLLLDVELSIEEFTWFNLLLNILNIQSIFFGMTILRLLWMLYSFIKPKLRMKLRNEKIAQFLIYLLCSIGFTFHTYLILDRSINEQLPYNPNYEIANRIWMPVVMFCLPIEEKLIDRNHRLTGNYLEKLTSDKNAESLFESIIYLNKSNEWIPFNLSLVKPFFFLHFKCFNITINREYNRRQFHFSINSQVLKMNFTNWFLKLEKKHKTVYFTTKTNETAFSNVLDLVYNIVDSRRLRYSVEQSEFTVKHEDGFGFMKRLLSTSYEDDFNDLDGQLFEFNDSEFSFRTLKVPVGEEDFGYELRDDLFDQLFAKMKAETTRNLFDNSDYTQSFVFNQFKNVSFPDDFTFNLGLIKKIQSAKNEENAAKLVLNLLNALFLWFDLGPLDLHPIFIFAHDYLLVYLYLHWPIYLLTQITRFVLFSHRWLKKFERPLYIRLNARRLRVPRAHRFYF